jgi:transposase-like protein
MDERPEDNTDDARPPSLAGEIVRPEPGWYGHGPGPHGGSGSAGRGRGYDSEFIATIIRAVVAGFKVVELSARYDIPRQTIYRWYADATKTRRGGDPKAVQRARGTVALELEVAAGECWRVIREHPGTELALKGVNALVNVQRHRAMLLGLNAPIVAQVNLHEVDAKDAELQEMIRSAKAASASQADAVRAQFEQRQQGGGQ